MRKTKQSKKQRNGGQSIVEIIFAVGLLGLVLSGAAVLLIKSLGVKGTAYDRRRAVELGTVVMEELVAAQKNDPTGFWQLNDVSGGTKSGYDGYVYSIDFTSVNGVGNCTAAPANCAEVKVRVDWQTDTSKSVEFNKFMVRQ